MLAHALLPLLVFEHCFIQIRFGIFEFFCFCFMSNKSFLILLNFTRYLFSVNTIFLLMRNIRNECWIPKKKYFMKVFHVSWNDPKTVFHKMLWKKNFTVYPSLKVYWCFQGNNKGTLERKGLIDYNGTKWIHNVKLLNINTL